MKSVLTALRIFLFVFVAFVQSFAQSWTAKLDKDVRFYQPTYMGVVVLVT